MKKESHENITPASAGTEFVPATSTNRTSTAGTNLLENYDTCESLLSLASVTARTFSTLKKRSKKVWYLLAYNCTLIPLADAN